MAGDDTGIYTIYDKIAEKNGPLFENLNDGAAVRSFRKLIGQHDCNANDYVLRRVGDRGKDGLIQGYLIPINVFSLNDIVVENGK